MQIQKIGKFHIIDQKGYIKNAAIVPIAQHEYRTVVQDMLEELVLALPENLHSVYIRGSVAKGIAIPHVSDIDLVILLHHEVLDSNLDDFIENKIVDKFPFVKGVELLIITINECKETRVQFLLKTQCGCIYGNDISNQLPEFKLDKVAYAHSDSFYDSMLRIRKKMVEKSDPDEIKKSCRWIMKRIIRTGYETVMLRDHSFTRDLYLNYEVFCKFHPTKAEDMKQALELAINPTDDKSMILNVMDRLVDYIHENVLMLR